MKKQMTGIIMATCAAVIVAATSVPLEIVSPKAGEIYHVGDTIKVQWIIHGGQMPEAVLPLLSPDEGMLWLQLTTDGIRPENTQAYHDSIGTIYWKVTDTLLFTGGLNPVKVYTISESSQINFYLPYNTDLGTFVSDAFAIRSSASAIKNHKQEQRINSVEKNLRCKNMPDAFTVSDVVQLDGRCFSLRPSALTGMRDFSRGTAAGIQLARTRNGNENQSLILSNVR